MAKPTRLGITGEKLLVSAQHFEGDTRSMLTRLGLITLLFEPATASQATSAELATVCARLFKSPRDTTETRL
jgi:hypothetical protein